MQIRFNNVEINYDDFGQGPVVLFIADQQQDSQMWNLHVGPLIAANYRVILLEIKSRCSAEVGSGAVIGLLNYLGIGRAAVCGQQQGPLLMQLLQDHSQRIACSYEPAGQADDDADSLTGETDLPALESNGNINRELLNFLNCYDPRRKVRLSSSMATAA